MSELTRKDSLTVPVLVSPRSKDGKQTLIYHFFGDIPTFDELGSSLVRGNSGNRHNLVETAKRISSLLPNYLYNTPMYGYELLNKAFQTNCKFKLENMQRFGDYSARIITSVVLSNYFNQKERLGREMSDVKGVVFVFDRKALHLDTLALCSAWMHKECTIVCPIGTYTILQLSQLFTCKKAGSKIIFHDRELKECYDYAKKIAEENHFINIEHEHTAQYSIIGAASLAYEVLSEKPDTQVLIVPSRHFEMSQFLVSGVSICAKTMKPAIQVVLATFEDIEKELESADKTGLFPDPLGTGWKSNVTKFAHEFNIFDEFDSENHGVVSEEDLVNFLKSISAPEGMKTETLSKPLNMSEFVSKVQNEYLTLWTESIAQNQRLEKFSSLENLKSKGFIDEVASITEDEAAISFVRCLEYTHTLADLKGVLPFAALWCKKIQPKNKKVVAIISGGFVDVMNFQTILDYSMGLSGSHFTLNIDLLDNSTSLSKILSLIGKNNISVKDVTFDRTGTSQTIQNFIRVFIQCSSKSFVQQEALQQVLTQQGYKFEIVAPKSPEFEVKRNANELKDAPRLNFEPTPINRIKDISEVTPESIVAAAKRIKNDMLRTPLFFDMAYSETVGCKVFLKFDNIQKTGSFKIRGSSNMVRKLIDEYKMRPKGLIAASAGNHAQGVALTSLKFGLPCTIVCPTYAPDGKLNWTRAYGAEVIKVGDNFEETVEYAEKLCKERDWLFVRPFNDVDIIEGQGTLGYEIHQDLPDVDTVLVNVGGGGMIAGIALYLKKINPKIRIIGIQSELVAPLIEFKRTESLRYITPTTTIADGVNVRVPGGVHSKILRELVDEYVTVSENEIASTIVNLLSSSRTLSEGAGCLGLAALLHKKIQVRPDEKVCVVLCGGNIDMSVLAQIYDYGLRSLGRFFTLIINSPDGPGNLAQIVAAAAQYELRVYEVRHVRGTGEIKWSEVAISISFYSNSFKHQLMFLNALVDQGRFPTVVGREFIKNHQQIYESFDKKVTEKKRDLERTAILKQEQYKAQQTRLNSSVI